MSYIVNNIGTKTSIKLVLLKQLPYKRDQRLDFIAEKFMSFNNQYSYVR